MKGTTQVLIFWAASVGIAFFIGLRKGHEKASPGLSPGEGSTSGGKIAGTGRSGNQVSQKSENTRKYVTAYSESTNSQGSSLLINSSVSPGSNPLTGEEIRQKLGPALVNGNLVNRNMVIADMLARLTPENAGEALRVFENTPRAYHTDNNYRLFLHAWGKVDGSAALDYIMDNPDAHRVGGGNVWAMSGWTQSDPEAARKFVESREKIDHGLYHGLIRGWSRIDLDGAEAYVGKMDDGELRHRLVDSLAESYLEQRGVQGSLAWVTRTIRAGGDEDFARNTFENVMKRSVPHNVTMVAEWISDNPDNPHLKPWVFEHTAGTMANSDPRRAANWIQEHVSNERMNGRVVGRVAGEWAEKNPAEAAEWVDSLRDTRLFDEDVAKRLSGSWAAQNPRAAMEWANTLEPNLRRPAYGSIVGRMPKEALESTAQWIRDAPVDNVMDGARAAYAHRIAGENPIEALDQAMLMTDTLGRERVSVDIAQRLFRKDPQMIRDWLPGSGLSEAAQQRIVRMRRND